MPLVLAKSWLTSPSAPLAVAAGGVATMYLPTYWAAANGLWQSDDYAHAPIILVVVVWLIWQVRERISRAPDQPSGVLGWPLLVLGMLSYVFGRTFDITSVEFLSQTIVVAAVVLLIKGRATIQIAWFAILYLIFMVPLPATFVDAATGPLKQWISAIVVDMLYIAGYPITRTGVLIGIGAYQLLVADACSGLNSMFSLTALGTLFMYITGRSDRWHNGIMLAAILPIAFVANILRVLALILITYHFGDAAGQGFLHGAAGILLMLVALGLFFILNAALIGGVKYIRGRRGLI